jgi:hypothetical protein
MNVPSKIAVAVIAAFTVLQLVRPDIPAKPATAELQVPPQVHRILERDCYSCHSDQRRLAWFDEIVPAYWLVRNDVLTAREHLNFSTLAEKPAAVQRATLFEAVNMIQLGAMPLPQFVKLHPGARITPEDLTTLKAYLAPWATPAPNAASSAAPQPVPTPVSLANVPPEFNGVPFDPTFETWKPLSTTDRGDNNTFRFILGNDVAVKAANSGSISPWPDGTRFAKVTWQRETRPDGLVHPGKFVQVELMIKDAALYKKTEGWGWGRWRGLDLKPYGTSAAFVTECTTCHKPLRGNDYVYTEPITTAKVPGQEIVNNASAALPASLPYQPLGWNAITLYVDPATHTTATLYGNEAAIQSTNFHANGTAPTHYKGDSILALVTWAQREDPHWFGARIPSTPQSVEFVTVATTGSPWYRMFNGPNLSETQLDPDKYAQRLDLIFGLTPARMP